MLRKLQTIQTSLGVSWFLLYPYLEEARVLLKSVAGLITFHFVQMKQLLFGKEAQNFQENQEQMGLSWMAEGKWQTLNTVLYAKFYISGFQSSEIQKKELAFYVGPQREVQIIISHKTVYVYICLKWKHISFKYYQSGIVAFLAMSRFYPAGLYSSQLWKSVTKLQGKTIFPDMVPFSYSFSLSLCQFRKSC